jgi:hypothetical protein
LRVFFGCETAPWCCGLAELCASSSAKAIKARGRFFLLRELF